MGEGTGEMEEREEGSSRMPVAGFLPNSSLIECGANY